MHLQITEIDTTINGIVIYFNKDHTFIPWTELIKFIWQYFTTIENYNEEE